MVLVVLVVLVAILADELSTIQGLPWPQALLQSASLERPRSKPPGRHLQTVCALSVPRMMDSEARAAAHVLPPVCLKCTE